MENRVLEVFKTVQSWDVLQDAAIQLLSWTVKSAAVVEEMMNCLIVAKIAFATVSIGDTLW